MKLPGQYNGEEPSVLKRRIKQRKWWDSVWTQTSSWVRFFELPSSADYFTLYLSQIHACTVNSLGTSLHSWQTWWKRKLTDVHNACQTHTHPHKLKLHIRVADTHLAITCASSFVVSFSVFRSRVALGAVISFFPTSRPAGQGRGRLAHCPLPTRMLHLRRPLKSWQGRRRNWLLFLLQWPLWPGRADLF